MSRAFAVTFDYLCPFARNVTEAVAAGLRSGRDWQVWFLPFSLSQVHVEEGGLPVWDREPGDEGTSGVLALCYGIEVRSWFPERFLDFHLATFAARHDEGRDINDQRVLREVAGSVGLDARALAERVATGDPLERVAAEHEEAVKRWEVFGVPTLIEGDEAVFVRMMERGNLEHLERILDMLGWTGLNEFKRTTIPR